MAALERVSGLEPRSRTCAGYLTKADNLPGEDGVTEPDVRLMLTVAYDGTDFHGFAAQPGQRTVAGVLARAIEVVTGSRALIVCAGRTDAGVHAWGQVVHVDVPGRVSDPPLLANACNKMLAPEVVVRSAVEAPTGFHARRSASSRLYKYLLYQDAFPSPFMARRAWHVQSRLDLAAMEQATYSLLGEHDFTSFCRRPKPKRALNRTGDRAEVSLAEVSLVRRVIEARWRRLIPAVPNPSEAPMASEAPTAPEAFLHGAFHDVSMLCFDIEASSFCHQMVRSVVSTLVEVGAGRKTAQDVVRFLEARDRSGTPPPAPPYGLYLWRVSYRSDPSARGGDPRGAASPR